MTIPVDLGCKATKTKKNILFLPLRIVFVLANSADPDEMSQCRPRYNATLCGISSGSSLFSKVHCSTFHNEFDC